MILWSKKIYPFYFCTVTSSSSLNSAQEFNLQHNYLCKCARYPDILREIVGYPSNVYFWVKLYWLIHIASGQLHPLIIAWQWTTKLTQSELQYSVVVVIQMHSMQACCEFKIYIF